jgi:hypothetical protein
MNQSLKTILSIVVGIWIMNLVFSTCNDLQVIQMKIKK